MNPIFALSLAGLAAAGFSARWNWWRKTLPGIPVLMYHKVGVPPSGSQLKKLWVSNERLREQMIYIRDNGYTPITFKELYMFWDRGAELPPRPIILTFDDGYQNNYTDAFPILKEFRFPAVIFIVTNTVESENAWHDPRTETRIQMLTWDQIRELKNGGWEIGSHTLSHPKLPQIDMERVNEEMQKSRAVLAEKLGEVPLTFAYPYGAGADDPRIRDAARAAGYRAAVSVHTGKWTVDRMKASPFLIPRVFVRGDENMFDFHLQLTRGRSRL